MGARRGRSWIIIRIAVFCIGSTDWARRTKCSSASRRPCGPRAVKCCHAVKRRGAEKSVINLRSPREIGLMREAGLLVWQAHQKAAALVRPGVTTAQIDAAIDRFFAEHSAVPLFKAFPGQVPFPALTCISLNDEVVHGIPGRRVLPHRHLRS